jgi:hypothetical protein
VDSEVPRVTAGLGAAWRGSPSSPIVRCPAVIEAFLWGAAGASALVIGALFVLGSVLDGMPESFVPGLTVLCNPLRSFFGKTWRSTEIQPV